MTTQTRTPKGVPTGGEFAAQARTEAGDLALATAPPRDDVDPFVAHNLIASGYSSVEEWARDSGFTQTSEQWPQRGTDYDWEDEDGVGVADLDERFLIAMEAAEANTDWGSTGIRTGSMTHWGPAQHSEDIAPGITRVSCAGHGGMKLSPERNEQVPEALRYPNGWYEEDVAWTAVAVAHPQAFDPEVVAGAHQFAKDYYPDGYEEATGIELKPGDSRGRDVQVFYDEHATSMLATSASGFTDEAGNRMVRVHARIGGRSNHGRPETEAVFVVTSEEYATRHENPSDCFIVDTDRHQPAPVDTDR